MLPNSRHLQKVVLGEDLVDRPEAQVRRVGEPPYRQQMRVPVAQPRHLQQQRLGGWIFSSDMLTSHKEQKLGRKEMKDYSPRPIRTNGDGPHLSASLLV